MARHRGGRGALAVLLVTALGGCVDRARVNSRCEWTDSFTSTLTMRSSGEREHLTRDVAVAEELGVRFGDAAKPRVGVREAGRMRRACTDSMFAAIVRDHRVTRADIDAVAESRTLWVDIVFVGIPMAVLLALAADRLFEHVLSGGTEDERQFRLLGLVAFVPVTSLVGLLIAQLWSWVVEMIRLGDGHISYRAFRLPASRHAWFCYFVLSLIMAVVAARVARRPRRYATGWRGGASRPAIRRPEC